LTRAEAFDNLSDDFALVREDAMNYLLKYLSTAPVVATLWMVITAGILIEFNRFFPDLLLHP
jgi:photosystem I subunit 9